MRYALLLHSLEAQDADISEEEMEPFKVAFDEYGKALAKAGVLVAGEILRPVADTTQLTMRNGGLTVQDGPFVDTKEKLAGTFVIDVPDLGRIVNSTVGLVYPDVSKTVSPEFGIHVPLPVSLAIIVSVIGATIGYTLIRTRGADKAAASTLGLNQ